MLSQGHVIDQNFAILMTLVWFKYKQKRIIWGSLLGAASMLS